jgi:hypothetical protein
MPKPSEVRDDAAVTPRRHAVAAVRASSIRPTHRSAHRWPDRHSARTGHSAQISFGFAVPAPSTGYHETVLKTLHNASSCMPVAWSTRRTSRGRRAAVDCQPAVVKLERCAVVEQRHQVHFAHPTPVVHPLSPHSPPCCRQTAHVALSAMRREQCLSTTEVANMTASKSNRKRKRANGAGASCVILVSRSGRRSEFIAADQRYSP